MMREFQEALDRIQAITGHRKVAAEFRIPNNEYMDKLIEKANITMVKTDNTNASLYGIPVVVWPFLPPNKGMLMGANGQPIALIEL